MSSQRLENLSAFGRAAVKLDGDFSELNRLSDQIQRAEIDSDSGLDHAVKLLSQFARQGEAIAEGIQEFSKSLQAARARSEAAAKRVSERATLVQQRKEQQNQMRGKLAQLEQKVKDVNANLSGPRGPDKSVLSDEEKRRLVEQLTMHLSDFIEGTQAIKQEAGRSNFKGIERDTQSLLEVLQSSRRKLDSTRAMPSLFPK